MTVYQWLCLLGIPALIAGVFKYLHTLIKRNADDNNCLLYTSDAADEL